METVTNLSVRLTELPKRVEARLDMAFVDNALGDLALRKNVEVKDSDYVQIATDLYPVGEIDAVATGSFRGSVTVSCVRCLADVTLKPQEKVNATFVPMSNVPKDEFEEGEDIDPSEADVFGHDGENLDLTAMVREMTVLSVPFAPLCSEDCKGICASCGHNKNETTCTCEPAIDPRLAALKEIKL